MRRPKGKHSQRAPNCGSWAPHLERDLVQSQPNRSSSGGAELPQRPQGVIQGDHRGVARGLVQQVGDVVR